MSPKGRCSSRWIGGRSRRRCSRSRRTSRAISRRRNARTQAARTRRWRRAASSRARRCRPVATAAAALDATVEADRAAVENAKVQLEYATITAPISGRTGALIVHPGNLVRANDADAARRHQPHRPNQCRRSASPRRSCRHSSATSPSGRCASRRSAPDETGRASKGQITFIDNAVDPTTGTIKIKGSFPNDDRRLWPGQFVNVVVTLTTDPAAVVVPTAAIQAGQQGDFVFVVKADQTVDLRPVTVERTQRRRKRSSRTGSSRAKQSSPTGSCDSWPAAASR